MNKKQMYQHIMANMADDIEVVKFCNKEIEMLDKKNAKKTNPEVEKYRSYVLALIQSNPDTVFTSKMVADSLGGSSRKAAVHLKYLADNGDIVRHEDKKNITYTLQ